MPEFNSAQFNGGGSATTDTATTATVVSDLLYAALRIAGITEGPGRTPSVSQLSDAFVSLKRMLSTWNLSRFTIFSTSIDQYQLGSGKQIYTIGKDPTGKQTADFDALRPNRITAANYYPFGSPASAPGTTQTVDLTFDQIPEKFDDIQETWDNIGKAVSVAVAATGPNISLRLPLRVLGVDQWARIRLQNVNTSIPLALYYDADYPIAGIHFWPIPANNGTLELFTWQPVADFQAQDDVVLLPDGYEEAIVYNLAIRCASMSPKQAQLGPDARMVANKALAAVKSVNLQSPAIDVRAPHGSRRGYFNYLTGDRP